MVLADTSVWIDHLRRADDRLRRLLDDGAIAGHPFVLGEIALGNLRQRKLILQLLADLPAAIQAADDEVLRVIEAHELAGEGIGYVDAHLIASTLLTPDARLWTRDKRLKAVATRLALAPDFE